MKEQTRQFIKGMGSIMNIYPCPRYEEIIPPQTVEQRMNAIWFRVKIACEKSLKELSSYEQEQKKQD